MPQYLTIEEFDFALSDGFKGKSNKKSLSRAFPSALHHQDSPVTKFYIEAGKNPIDVQLSSPFYKRAYADYVMSTIIEIPGADFSAVDLDYGTNTSTSLANRPPALIFKEAFSHPSNTIAPGGKGPNVATLDIEDSKTPGVDRPLLDGSTDATPPFSSPNEDMPYNSSKKIAAGSVHGGDTTDRGVLGSSPASLGDE